MKNSAKTFSSEYKTVKQKTTSNVPCPEPMTSTDDQAAVTSNQVSQLHELSNFDQQTPYSDSLRLMHGCADHQSSSFSQFCIRCSVKNCAMCTNHNETHYLHKAVDLDELNSCKRVLSEQVVNVSGSIEKAKASFNEINKLLSTLTGTATTRIQKLNTQLVQVLEQVEDIRRTCVTAILREAQTELTKTASSRERRKYAQHDKTRRYFKKRASDFVENETGNLRVLMDLKETGLPLHVLKVNSVNDTNLPKMSKVKLTSGKLIASLRECVLELKTKADKSVEMETGSNIMLIGSKGNRFYNVQEDKWSTGQPIPTKRYNPAATMWDSKVIVAGGYLIHSCKVTNSAEQFDPRTNTWTEIPNMQVARRYHAVVNLEGSLYAIGGYDENDKPLSSAEKFNAQSNSWKLSFTLLTARAQFAAVLLRNWIFITNGRQTIDSDRHVLASCETYRDQGLNTVAVKSLTFGRFGHAAVSNIDSVYVFGEKSVNSYIPAVEQYDWHADMWTELNYQIDWKRSFACSFNGCIVMMTSEQHGFIGYNSICQVVTKLPSVIFCHHAKNRSVKRILSLRRQTQICTTEENKNTTKPLLVCVGCYMNQKTSNNEKGVPVYDLGGNKWHFIEPTDTFRESAATTWNNKVVVTGGRIDIDLDTDAVEQFDPLTGKWTSLPKL